MQGADDPTAFTPPPAPPSRGSFPPAADDDRTAFTPPPPSSRGSFVPGPADDDRTSFTPPPVAPSPPAPRGPATTPETAATVVGDGLAPSAASSTFDEGALEAPPGSFIGGYQVERTLGRGGMGIVYLARDPRLDRRVALKVLPVTAGTSAHAVQRFEREARTIAALDHPAIRPIHGWGRDDQARVFWLAMGFVDGRPYDDVVKEAGLGHESPRRAARVVADAARALAFAHRKGVIHRDVKPSNLMIEAGPAGLKVHVVDFGLARLEGAAELTVEGQVMGTLRFMPPEQALGAEASALSDVYSLGATLFWALTGEGPYDVQRIENLQLRLARGDAARRPTDLRRDVPPELEAIALVALELAPTDRYAGADALADDLERWLAGEPVLARPPSRWRLLQRAARRQARLVVPAALLVLALGVATGAWALRRHEADQRRAAADRRLAELRAPIAPGAEVETLLAAREALLREDRAHASAEAVAAVDAALASLPELLRAGLDAAEGELAAAVSRWARPAPAPGGELLPLEVDAPAAVTVAAERAAAVAGALAPVARDLGETVATSTTRVARRAADALALARGEPVRRTPPTGATLVPLAGEPRPLAASDEDTPLPGWGVLVRHDGGRDGQRTTARFYDPLDVLAGFPALAEHRAARQADMILVQAPGRAPFLIDRDEVTARRFAEFVDDDLEGYGDDAWWTPEGRAWRDRHPGRREALRRRLASARGEGAAEGRLPVTGVSVHEARAFAARWRRRLPTEAEWRLAAGLRPWRSPPPSRVPEAEARPRADTEPPFDTSPCGARNLAGNVAEWVEGPARVMGGTFHGLSLGPWPGAQTGRGDEHAEVGFRCAADLPSTGGAR